MRDRLIARIVTLLAGGGVAMSDIPWNELAVVVRKPERGPLGEREIVAEGMLGEVLDEIGRSLVDQLSRLIISMPDRSAPPYRFDPAEIADLLRRRNR